MHFTTLPPKKNVVSRWHTYARRVLDWKFSKQRQDSKRTIETTPPPSDAPSDALLEKLSFARQASVDVKQMKEVSVCVCGGWGGGGGMY